MTKLVTSVALGEALQAEHLDQAQPTICELV